MSSSWIHGNVAQNEQTQVSDALTMEVLRFYNYPKKHCMVIGPICKVRCTNYVKTAHIWSHRIHGAGLTVLQLNLDDVNSVRSCLRLYYDVEQAFDRNG